MPGLHATHTRADLMWATDDVNVLRSVQSKKVFFRYKAIILFWVQLVVRLIDLRSCHYNDRTSESNNDCQFHMLWQNSTVLSLHELHQTCLIEKYRSGFDSDPTPPHSMHQSQMGRKLFTA